MQLRVQRARTVMHKRMADHQVACGPVAFAVALFSDACGRKSFQLTEGDSSRFFMRFDPIAGHQKLPPSPKRIWEPEQVKS